MVAALQLGDAQQTQAAVAAGGTAAAAIIPTITAAAWAIPVVGAGVAAALLAITFISRRGARRETASTIVNELEPILQQNLEGFKSGPGTPESQATALKVFDDVWAHLTSAKACGNADLGGAGEACISDRNRGGQWDWFSYYRDPIERAEMSTRASILPILPGASSPDTAALVGLGLIAAALILGGIK